MVFVEFTKFYKKTKERFDLDNFDKNVLYDIYGACLTNLMYDEKEDIFYNQKNNREYTFDYEKLSFYPKIPVLKNRDMFVEFDSTNHFRVTYAYDNDLIIVGGHALNHTKTILDNPVNVDYKWLYYYVFPNVIPKLKEVNLYDDEGELIPLTINNASYFLQYIQGVKDICKIEVESNSINSLEPFKMQRNYTSYLDEIEKLNTLKATLNDVVLDDLSGVEIDYVDGFKQSTVLAKEYYKEIVKNAKVGDAFLKRF